MSQRAFALTESAKDSFVDASVTVSPDGHSVAIGERLKEGHGYIVTDNEQEANALAEHPALKSVAVKEAEEAKPAPKAKAETKANRGDQR